MVQSLENDVNGIGNLVEDNSHKLRALENIRSWLLDLLRGSSFIQLTVRCGYLLLISVKKNYSFPTIVGAVSIVLNSKN